MATLQTVTNILPRPRFGGAEEVIVILFEVYAYVEHDHIATTVGLFTNIEAADDCAKAYSEFGSDVKEVTALDKFGGCTKCGGEVIHHQQSGYSFCNECKAVY